MGDSSLGALRRILGQAKITINVKLSISTFFVASNCRRAQHHETMKLTNHSAVPVYTISGSSTARPLPEWLARKRKRSLKNDHEYASRIELLQDFEFEEASQCVRISDDGDWVMSTGIYCRLR